jgi:4-alpha-glucanotransferase
MQDEEKLNKNIEESVKSINDKLKKTVTSMRDLEDQMSHLKNEKYNLERILEFISLAEKMHDKFCRCNEGNWCAWKTETEWGQPDHKMWFLRAVKLLQSKKTIEDIEVIKEIMVFS